MLVKDFLQRTFGSDIAKDYTVGNLGDISVALVGGGLAHSCGGGGSADDEQTTIVERLLQFLRQGFVHLSCYHHYHRLLTFQQEVVHILYLRENDGVMGKRHIKKTAVVKEGEQRHFQIVSHG